MILSNETLKKKVYSNPLYAVYLCMKKRCYTPSNTGYENYGGRGITVCEEWKKDFLPFYEWAISTGYYYDTEQKRGERLSIDRIDNNGNYCSENCRWISLSENVRRARSGKKLSDETKRKISEKLKGVPLSDYHKMRLSICSKGKGKGNKNGMKGIYEMYNQSREFIHSFKGNNEIKEYFFPKKISIGNINEAGKGRRKTAYGFIWVYKKEY